MNLKPLGNRLVVEPIEEQDITAGGIVLPETAKEKPQKATVLAVGEGERNDKGERVTPEFMSTTSFFSRNIPEPRSRWTERNILSCANPTFSRSFNNSFF